MFGAQASWHHLGTFEWHRDDGWPLVPGVLLQVQAPASHHAPALLPAAAQTHAEVACRGGPRHQYSYSCQPTRSFTASLPHRGLSW